MAFMEVVDPWHTVQTASPARQAEFYHEGYEGLEENHTWNVILRCSVIPARF